MKEIIVSIIVPIVMIICGFMMYKFPPKDRFGCMGYRTARSRQSDESFLFAQIYCGKLWIIVGVCMLIITIILSYIYKLSIYNFFVLAQVIIMVLTIIPVECKLKEKFMRK